MGMAKKIFLNLVERASFGALFDSKRRPIGYYVNRLSEDERKQLQNLTSDEIKNVDPIWKGK